LNIAGLSGKILKEILPYSAFSQGAPMMAISYSARDIVEAAIVKEGKRRSFYATASELSSNADMKALFHFLSEEEGKHVATFSQIRDSLPEGTGPIEYRDDIAADRKSINDDPLYSKLDSREFVQLAIDNWNAFRLAIGFEKDAILQFTEFLPHLSEPNQKIVRGLIEEENEHIGKLVELLEQIGE
jgi:rubrerythrin